MVHTSDAEGIGWQLKNNTLINVELLTTLYVSCLICLVIIIVMH
jgi:hypothetical protein